MRGIAIRIAIKIETKLEIEIEVETGFEIAIEIVTVPGCLTGAKAKCQATKASKAMSKTRWVCMYIVGFDQVRDSIGFHMDSDPS